ncbi:transaldolase [Streptomyces sp. NPDC057910]|uniref:transaldolase n=1 Tax=Streptomyces sp. NPDC057910 TaxID=3346278 RepID=UPI0036E89FEC
MTAQRLRQLSDAGILFWLDGVSRFLLRSGALAALVRDWGVSGVTTNPALFLHAVGTGSSYAEQLRGLAARDVSADQAVRELAGHDFRAACDVLMPVHLARRGTTGLVSVDIDPRLADDSAATVDAARRLWREVDRPNLLIKIPATDSGLESITACVAEGIGVNATPVFSAERYQQVAEAHLAGLELAARAGRPLARIHSVVSFHVGPIARAVDPRLDALATGPAQELRGKAALAVARLVLARHRATHESDAWQSYARLGARRQRLLWAGTTVHDAAYRDTHYADGLFAPGTVAAMPEQLLWAVADHGRTQSIQRDGAIGPEVRQTLDSLAALGIALDDLARGLEAADHEEALASWQRLLDVVTASLEKSRA